MSDMFQTYSLLSIYIIEDLRIQVPRASHRQYISTFHVFFVNYMNVKWLELICLYTYMQGYSLERIKNCVMFVLHKHFWNVGYFKYQCSFGRCECIYVCMCVCVGVSIGNVYVYGVDLLEQDQSHSLNAETQKRFFLSQVLFVSCQRKSV